MDKILYGLLLCCIVVLVYCVLAVGERSMSPEEYCHILSDRSENIVHLRDRGAQINDVIAVTDIPSKSSQDEHRLLSVINYVYETKDSKDVIKSTVGKDCLTVIKNRADESAKSVTPIFVPTPGGGMSVIMM